MICVLCGKERRRQMISIDRCNTGNVITETVDGRITELIQQGNVVGYKCSACNGSWKTIPWIYEGD